MEFHLIAPTYITIPMVTVKDKNCSLSINWYRNVNHFDSAKVKIIYTELMRPQIQKLPPFKEGFKPLILYEYFNKTATKSDVDNWCSINNKFFQDALVKYTNLPDDDYDTMMLNIHRYGGPDPKKKGKILITISEYIKGMTYEL